MIERPVGVFVKAGIGNHTVNVILPNEELCSVTTQIQYDKQNICTFHLDVMLYVYTVCQSDDPTAMEVQLFASSRLPEKAKPITGSVTCQLKNHQTPNSETRNIRLPTRKPSDSIKPFILQCGPTPACNSQQDSRTCPLPSLSLDCDCPGFTYVPNETGSVQHKRGCMYQRLIEGPQGIGVLRHDK